MDEKMLLEVFGYIGSALVVISMLMPSIVKLRVINTIGSVVSGIYAVICGALPLGIMNACLIVINVYRLLHLLKSNAEYQVLRVKPEEATVNFFLNHYKEDIKKYFYDFDPDSCKEKDAFMVFCEGSPAGCVIGGVLGEDFILDIDYTTPTFRDSSVEKYLFGKIHSLGVKKVKYRGKLSEVHVSFIKKFGFEEVNGEYVLNL